MTIEELTKLRDEIMSEIGVLTKRKIVKYWTGRAELVSRSRTETVNYAAEKMADGQISICYETADQVELALKEAEGKANPDASSKIPEKGLSAV